MSGIAAANKLLVQFEEGEFDASETIRAEEHAASRGPHWLGVETRVPRKPTRVLAFGADEPKVTVPLDLQRVHNAAAVCPADTGVIRASLRRCPAVIGHTACALALGV